MKGEFPLAAHEVIDPYFLLFSSACWNGIALGAIDIAKKHVKRTEHADMGLRVADFPIIQVPTPLLCPPSRQDFRVARRKWRHNDTTKQTNLIKISIGSTDIQKCT